MTNYLIVDIEEEHNIILEDTITLEKLNCIKYDLWKAFIEKIFINSEGFFKQFSFINEIAKTITVKHFFLIFSKD